MFSPSRRSIAGISEPKKLIREERGALHTLTYKMYLRNEFGPISPIHDIPLYANKTKKIYNIVIEVPRWTNAKMEMDCGQQLNPIVHDLDNDKIRYYPNVFPHHGSVWNYGAFPQTWECPVVRDKNTGHFGDNDPVDVLEIGYKVGKIGEVRQVKVLGAIALVDQGCTDWKVFAIDTSDPMADNVHDMADLEKCFSGMVDASINWFKVYKLCDGKPENFFSFNGKAQNREFTQELLKMHHKYWKCLIAGKLNIKTMQCANQTLKDSPYRIPVQEGEKIVQGSSLPAPPEQMPPEVNAWFYAELTRRQLKSSAGSSSNQMSGSYVPNL